MNAIQFVQEFKDLKESIESSYFSKGSDMSKLEQLKDAGLDDKQLKLVKQIVGEALTDSLYTVLLGLDGCASISKHQESYRLLNESGVEITGELEELAWEVFHEKYT